MAVYMPPIARKKKVPEHYNPDTFRVISTDAENYHPHFPDSVAKPVFKPDPKPARKLLPDIPVRKTRVLPYHTLDFRAHNPHPMSCDFLRHNARLLNEPVCTVFTQQTHPEQHRWWPHQTSSDPLNVPDYTKDTIYRGDFEYSKEKVPHGSTRHLANPNTKPALGSVPVNFLLAQDGCQRLFQEKLSYEHQYDSRADPNYPIRSKRHGAFVWKQLAPAAAQQFIDSQQTFTENSGPSSKASSARMEGNEHMPEMPSTPVKSVPMRSPPATNITLPESTCQVDPPSLPTKTDSPVEPVSVASPQAEGTN